MNSRKAVLSVAAAAVFGLGSTVSHAGSVSIGGSGYATEALTPATTVTLPTLTYTMGVPRTASPSGDFVVIIDAPVGTTINCGTAPATLTFPVGFTSATSAVKRCGVAPVGGASGQPNVSEIAYNVQINANPSAVGDQFRLTGLQFTNPNFAVPPGISLSFSLALKDPGETSQIDNAASIGFTWAFSFNTVGISGLFNFTAFVPDTATVADVNCTFGPLFCFLANATPPADTNLVAAAYLAPGQFFALMPDGVTVFNFATTTGTVSISSADTAGFSGLAANGFCLDLNANGTYCEAGEVFTVPAGGPATLTIPAAAYIAGPGAAFLAANSFQTSATTSLGVGRSFSLTGTVHPQVGAPHPIVDFFGTDANYWQWSSNAVVLESPWFSTFNSGGAFQNRFILLNKGAIPVGYTAKCLVEAGNSATSGAGAAGTIPANGTLVIDATTVCSFTTATRGAVIFTISAPVGSVKGTFQQVNPQATVTNVPMDRPFGNNNTSNGTLY